MLKEIQEIVLENNDGTGIAGWFYRCNVKGGSKRAMFYSFALSTEQSGDWKRSFLSVSTQFYLDKFEVLDRMNEINSNLILTIFKNWWIDKRRKNQRDYERSVSFSIGEHDRSSTLNETLISQHKKEKQMTYVYQYLLNFANEEENYILRVELGLHNPERSEKRHYLDFPNGAVSHVTYKARKNKLSEKLKKFMYN